MALQRLEKLRKAVRAPVLLRGTSSEFHADVTREHFYHIDPLAGSNAGFHRQLRATVNAAVSRAMKHAGSPFYLAPLQEKNFENIPLPKVMAFSFKTDFQESRRVIRPELKPAQEPHNEGFEIGWNGRQFDRTFQEIKYATPQASQLLFEVQLTADEFRDAVRDARRRLQTQGHTLESLRNLRNENPLEARRVALKALGQDRFPEGTETTHHGVTPYHYVIGELVREKLARKVLREMARFAQEQ